MNGRQNLTATQDRNTITPMRTSERGTVGVWTVVLVLAGLHAWTTATTATGLLSVVVALADLGVALVALDRIQDVARRD